MSQSLKNYIDTFLAKDISAGNFADSYMMKWKAERDNNLLGKDGNNLSELLSSVFCLADIYNPDDDRDEYEFDDEQLRQEINKLMDIYINE